MKYELFANDDQRYDEAQRMWEYDDVLRHNRRIRQEFYNGYPPLDECELEELGIKLNTNFLFGYNMLDLAQSELSSMFFSRQMVVIERQCPRDAKDVQMDRTFSRLFSTILRGNMRFRKNGVGTVGDNTLHGHSALHFNDTDDLFPEQVELDKVLIPRGFVGCEDDLTHWVIVKNLRHRALENHLNGKNKHWKRDVLKQLLGDMSADKYTESGTFPVGEDDEEIDDNQDSHDRNRGIDCYYFYEKNKDNQIDLTIMVKGQVTSNINQQTDRAQTLYRQESAYKRARNVFIPIVLDFRLGGKPTWHKVLGLGELNYDQQYAAEYLTNRAFEATDKQLRTWMQPRSNADIEALQQIRLKNDSILPAGVDFVEKGHHFRTGDAMNLIQFMRTTSADNARQHVTNAGNRHTDELEVQAQQRAREAEQSKTNRTADFLDYWDRVFKEIYRRFYAALNLEPSKMPEEVIKFKAFFEKNGINPSSYSPDGVEISASRLPGGLTGKARTMIDYLVQTMQMRTDDKKQVALQALDAMTLSDPLLTEMLDPAPNARSTRAEMDEQAEALQAAASIMATGIAHPVDSTDNHQLNLFVLLASMNSMIQKAAETKSVTLFDNRVFSELGVKYVHHMQFLQQRGSEAEAKGASQYLQQAATAWDSVIQQFGQQQNDQEQSKEELDMAIKMRKQDLAERQFALTEQKTIAQVDHRNRSQVHRERMGELSAQIQAAHVQLSQAEQERRALVEAAKMADKELGQ